MSALTVALLVLASPLFVAAQCPQVHIFGARETTVAPGYGTSLNVVNSIISAFPGATSEAISYPACGGQASCGSVSYANSVIQGVAAVASQVNAFNTKCPNSLLVLVGYSQGGQIFDDAYCGGGDTNEGLSSTAIPISTAAQKQIKAAIFMGDPRHIPGLSYNVGTCQASGVSHRNCFTPCSTLTNTNNF
jgi:acetylxylan esterase